LEKKAQAKEKKEEVEAEAQLHKPLEIDGMVGMHGLGTMPAIMPSMPMTGMQMGGFGTMGMGGMGGGYMDPMMMSQFRTNF